jgi:Zinc-binding dehydrogenase
LKPRGVYVLLGGSTSRICACLFFGPLISLVERKKMGFLWWKPFQKEDVAFLKDLIAAGKIKPAIDRTYPLSEVPEALAYLETGNALGKSSLPPHDRPRGPGHTRMELERVQKASTVADEEHPSLLGRDDQASGQVGVLERA